MKKNLYSEWAYVIGIVVLAFGTALMEKADFGMSMVIAPASILYEKLSLTFSFLTLGTMNYLFEGLLLIALVIALRKFRPVFLLSFATAFIYSTVLDGFILLIGAWPAEGILVRIVWYLLGAVFGALGVAFLFHTYVPPEVYELTVKEIAAKYHWDTARVKTVYDICSMALSVVLTFCFFGFGVFKGIGWGTVVCAFINGPMIGVFNRILEKRLTFEPKFSFGK